MLGASMFSSAGIAEYYFRELGIEICLANELIPRRAQLYEFFYPEAKMIQGDITDPEIFEKYNNELKKQDYEFLIATPPCQGMSTLGKKDYETDIRNFLVFYVLEVIKNHNFKYIFIENVPKFINLNFPYKDSFYTLQEILETEFGEKYNIKVDLLNAKDFGVPQSRERSIIRMYKKGLEWKLPKSEPEITLEEAIGSLPSLEASEESGIKWHYAKWHNEREIKALRHTPEGQSAMQNEVHYPKKENGDRIRGFHNTYKRMRWDKPAPARTMNSGNMGGHNNVHPGRQRADGTQSDARVLTLRELFIVSSLPANIDLPDWYSQTLIRSVIGESIPPLFSKKIVAGIQNV